MNIINVYDHNTVSVLHLLVSPKEQAMMLHSTRTAEIAELIVRVHCAEYSSYGDQIRISFLLCSSIFSPILGADSQRAYKPCLFAIVLNSY